jgi:hypothetical protein
MRRAISGRSQGKAVARAAAEHHHLGVQRGQAREVLGRQVLEPAAFPVDALAGRADDHAVVHRFFVDPDPARAVAGDGLDVGLVGLEFHGCGRGNRVAARPG